ncbi:MAG: ABC transporter permease [Chloroflexi bacterium]|nr:ABC transporter permease [Chloroflexota bacterium]
MHTEAPWRGFARRFLRNHIGVAGAIIVLVCVGMAVLAPVLAPYGPEETHPNWKLYPPNEYFLLGTDEFGRDILSRIMYGAQISLEVGLISVTFALVAGGVSGLIAGFFGGWSDAVIMRSMDVLFAFPAILLAIGIMAVLGTGIGNAILAIGIVYAPAFARLTRASVLSLKETEFVQSARVLGSGDARILRRHVLPNLSAPLIVQISFSLSTAILTEAALSFLGLGTPPSVASWGSMLSASRRYVELDPWPAIFPGLAIMLLVLGFNLFGDGLRDVLDPTTS